MSSIFSYVKEQTDPSTPETSIFSFAKEKAPSLGKGKGKEGMFLASPEERQGALRTQARVGESILGFGGTLRDLPENLYDTAKFVATGEKPTEKTIKNRDLWKKILLPPAISGLPTSHDIREKVTRPLTGEYLEPKSEGEYVEDELTQLLTTAAMPLGSVKTMMTGVTSALAGFGAKTGIKALGGGERAQTAAQLGTTVIAGMMMQPSAKSLSTKLYEESQSALPQGASIPKQILQQEFNSVMAKAQKGGRTASDKFAINKMREILGRARGRNIDVEELIEAKKKAYKEIGDWESPKETREGLRQVTPALNRAIESYGNQNPSWLKKYRAADEVYSAIKQGEKLGNYVGKVIKSSKGIVLSPILYGLFAHPGTTATIGGAALAGQKAIYFARTMKSPILRKHYFNVLKAATKENPGAVISALEDFNDALEKEGIED